MSTNIEATALAEGTLPPTPLVASLPHKRALEEDHAPAVSSPLNPHTTSNSNPQADVKHAKAESQEDFAAMVSQKPTRMKRDTLKKREGKSTFGSEAARAPTDVKGKQQHQRQEAPPRPLPATHDLSPLRWKLAPPRPSDFEPARGPVFSAHHQVSGPDGEIITFYETSEHVYNKRNFHYNHCIADPDFPSSFYYRRTESEPYGPHISFEDAATHMFFDKEGRHVTTDKGFRMAKANVAVRQGRWYWECKITQGAVQRDSAGKVEGHGHVRMGFARREASLDAPVGYDAYSYGIRDLMGQKVHMSRPKDFFPAGEDCMEGDVIGLEIGLPSEALHRKIVQGLYNPAVDLLDDEAPSIEAANIVRDRIPIRFKQHIYFEKIDYHTCKELEDVMNPMPLGNPVALRATEPPNPHHKFPALRTLPNSYINVYKNGVLKGTAFKDLLAFLPPASKPLAQVGARDGMDDGMLGYYPALSVFRGGAAEVNFGPDFWYPPPGYSQAKNKTASDDVVMGGTADEYSVAVAAARAAEIRPMAERYDEQIVEDIVADLVDEVDFWVQDGGRVIDRTGGRDAKADLTIGAVSGRDEIKELVQDD